MLRYDRGSLSCWAWVLRSDDLRSLRSLYESLQNLGLFPLLEADKIESFRVAYGQRTLARLKQEVLASDAKGKVAEALGNLSEARTDYLQDPQITAEFNDQHGLGISLRNLARF